ncbi:MAG: hypothetical protein AMJ65_17825, partial [Phycisphaerae bacterium SG8_4]
MERNSHIINVVAIAGMCIALSSYTTVFASAKDENIFTKTGNLKGGFIVHVGCGDGTLIAALGNNKQYVIQGLEKDHEQVERARHTVRATGAYGRLSIKHWQGRRLPFAENQVNLLIIDDGDTGLLASEIKRVLTPRGRAVVHKDCQIAALDTEPVSAEYSSYIKPVPEEIDDWPHYLYGADNNAVSRDQAVGPPQRIQWVCGPAYARSHEINSSMAAMVAAGGRIFYIWDEGPVGQPEKRFPSQWSLIARDGFNGVLLWKLPMPDWGWRQWHVESRWDNPRERASMLRQLPRTTTRRLVAAGQELYVTLGYEAPVSVLYAASGQLLHVLEGTEGTDEILLDSETLFLCVRDTDRTHTAPGRDFRLSQNNGGIVAVDPQNGRILWKSE